MAHRNVMDKDGNSKSIHSSHGDVSHKDASSQHSVMKQGHAERCKSHGEACHPNAMSDNDHDGDGQSEGEI
jgi:hypothetical protein